MAKRLAPFNVVAVVAILIAATSPGAARGQVGLAAGLAAILFSAGVAIPWSRLPAWAETAITLAYFPVAALLRDATGGASSVLTPLVLLPVLWLGLYSGRRALGLSIVAMVATLAVPIAVIGPPHYPPTEWQRVVLWLALAPMVGLTVQNLVGSVRALLARVEDLAGRDELTGLPNRRAWDERLGHEIAIAERDGEPLTIALIDLDHFKTYNDVHGHQAGDQLLARAARHWRDALREVDLLARYGGEEFALILHGCSAEEATNLVERVRSATPDGQTCSAGIAGRRPGEGPDALVARADRLLYAAKAAGRDRSLTLPPLPQAAATDEGHRRPLVSRHLARLPGQ